MSSSDFPTYVYKLVPSTAPIPEGILPDRLPVSELDQTSGFIHLSTASQVPNTLKFFFKDDPLVYILRVDFKMVEKDIRWESPDAKICGPRPGEGLFPHLYNGFKLGRDEIESTQVWKYENGWDAALGQSAEWLVY